MEIKEFQKVSKRTMPSDKIIPKTLNCALGIAGEGGEVVDLIKKSVFQGHELDKTKLVEELGDLMFYVSNLATTFNIDMSKVLQSNVDKLAIRFPNGFNFEDSKKRVDHMEDKKHEKRV